MLAIGLGVKMTELIMLKPLNLAKKAHKTCGTTSNHGIQRATLDVQGCPSHTLE